MEVCRVFQIAEGRHAVRLAAGLAGPCGAHKWRGERADAEANTKPEHMPARRGGQSDQPLQARLPILAAFSASHHHMSGKLAAPYFGSSAGRPKRSQRAVRTFG